MTERRFGTWTVFDAPVLMVDPVVLSNVEPRQPERAILAPRAEQVADPNGAGRPRAPRRSPIAAVACP